MVVPERMQFVDKLWSEKVLDALVHRVHKHPRSTSAEPANVENSEVFPSPELWPGRVGRLSRVVNKG